MGEEGFEPLMSHLETPRGASQLSYRTIGHLYQLDIKKQNLGCSLTACRNQWLKLHVLAFNPKLYLTICTWNIYSNTFCKNIWKTRLEQWKSSNGPNFLVKKFHQYIFPKLKNRIQPEVCTIPETLPVPYTIRAMWFIFFWSWLGIQGKKKCDTSLSNLFIFYWLTKI